MLSGRRRLEDECLKVRIVGLNFRRNKRGTRYRAGALPLRLGDYCVVKTDHGTEVARVATNPMILPGGEGQRKGSRHSSACNGG